ncbi:MAG: TldD/PmbA family protein [Alphaproteobacteria bacterium]
MAADPADVRPLFDIADRLIAEARRLGADAADVLAVDGTAVEAGCRLGAVEDIGRSETRDLGLRVMVGQRQASVSTTDLSERGLAPLAERAVAMARHAPEDPFCGLAPEDRLAREVPDLDLLDTAEPDTEALYAMALEAEDVARQGNRIVNSNGAGAGYSRTRVVLATSAGFARAYGVTSYSLSCTVVAGDENGMEVDGDFGSARHFADLRAPAEIGREAAHRASRRLGPRKIATAQRPIIFDPRMAAGLVGHFLGAISGSAVARGTSFLKDAMGTAVFAPGITIRDDPHKPRGLRSKPFDGEGVANRAMALVEGGQLTTWLLDCATARQLGLETTGHASRGVGGPPSPSATNVWLEPGPLTPDGLMADIADGFFVTTLFGQGVNGVTGDYSRGAAGFHIKDGVLDHAVSEVTVAGNLKDMFRQMTPANDLEFRRGVDAPTVRVDGMTIAGA